MDKKEERLVIKYRFEDNTTFRSIGYSGSNLQELKKSIAQKEKKKIKNYKDIILVSKEEPTKVLKSQGDFQKLIKGTTNIKLIILSQPPHQTQLFPNVPLNQNYPNKNQPSKCSFCTRIFSSDEKVYIEISQNLLVHVICGSCDKKNSDFETYGISYDKFRGNQYDYGIRSIFILKGSEEPAFFENFNVSIEEPKKIKEKYESLRNALFELEDELNDDSQRQIENRLRTIFAKNPHKTKKELFKEFRDSKI